MNVLFAGYIPQRIFLDFGFAHIYWYSLFILSGILAAYFVSRRIYLKQHADPQFFVDLVFYLILIGIIGARLWHVFIFQWPYYGAHPYEIIQIWQGGIAIQGALLAGVVTLYWYSRKHRFNPWQMADYLVVGVALGQAIGRWGNYFNQELYGKPTDLPWGIFISSENRVVGYEHFSYFHPTFLYESVLDFALFFILLRASRSKRPIGTVTAAYFVGYGIIRFIVDFFRIDPMPMFGFLRSSQIISLVMIIMSLGFWFRADRKAGTVAKA